MPQTRCAIVGTAQSWRLTPWDDPGLHIVGLNDAYTLGFPRADEWYELHPITKFYYRDPAQRVVEAAAIPPGHYVRPRGHLEWLQAQARTIPVWLQDDPPAGWPPQARRLPLADLEARYGAYWASGPAYEVMHLYDRGYREFHIYGIHLATAQEYREQRPNFEFLLGRLLGPQVRLTVSGPVRIYDGPETGVRIVLPVASPLLQHGWKYAFEPKPTPPPDPDAAEWAAVQQEKAALIRALVQWPAGRDKRAALERLRRLEVIETDIRRQRAKRAVVAGTLVTQEV